MVWKLFRDRRLHKRNKKAFLRLLWTISYNVSKTLGERTKAFMKISGLDMTMSKSNFQSISETSSDSEAMRSVVYINPRNSKRAFLLRK